MSSSETVITTPTTSRSLAGIPTGPTSDVNAFPSTITTISNIPSPTNGWNNGNNGSNNGGGGGSGGGGGGVNSTLYLFTFLTTLLLLLAVSCGIVIRSFILRRRFHRRVEEAIAAGVLLPGQGDAGMGPGGNVGAFRRPIGEKPKMWEVWIDPSAGIDKQSSPSGEWSGIQPVAATRIYEVSRSIATPPKTEPIQQEAPVQPPLLGRLGLHSIFRRNRHQTRAAPSINPTPSSPETALPTLGYGASAPQETTQADITSASSDGNRSVQVAVFIAMPDSSRPRYVPDTSTSPADENGVKGKQRSLELPSTSTDEHEIPDVCLGISQVQVARDTNASDQDQAPTAPKS
ncbi:hypothetical protein RSOLAG1IB_04019 [Rhizoctonia solani AG-1 IB]|uniref:Uncharacterized protein n=1 Tax=Thanatephorus cucumeris (strain AG1-IB / isolate 7/3/14) TaxID=1108050 RepID=A0A0B7FSW3_THACB|nr:hypothetical protein RSOLAG1IB_04019 [Rhizoctonia solani AG-1 IB]